MDDFYTGYGHENSANPAVCSANITVNVRVILLSINVILWYNYLRVNVHDSMGEIQDGKKRKHAYEIALSVEDSEGANR